MKDGIKKTAGVRQKILAAILGGSLMLGAPSAQSYVLPVIDGAKIAQDAMNWALDAADRATTLANWVTQLQNWRQNLANLIRRQMARIVGEQMMNAREERQIRELFQQRKQRCLKLANSTSQRYCTRTVELEEMKYNEFKEIDKLVQETFNDSINHLIAAQNQSAGSNTGSGASQAAENEVIAKLQELNNKIKQHQNRINSIDQLIGQYRNIRTQLTKNQLMGDSSLSNTLSRATGAAALQKNANDYLNKANTLRNNSIGISNRF